MMENGLPQSWIEAALGDLISLEYGKSLPANSRSGEGHPVMGSNGEVGRHSEYLVKGPGIVVGRKGSNGEVTWVEENFFPIDTTYYVVPKEIVDMKYIFNFLRYSDLKTLNRSSAIPGLNRNDAYDLNVPVPPIAEQKRIVAKLDAAFAHLDTLKAKLDRIPELLKSFRQAVLTQAVTGKLTEEWREFNICSLLGLDKLNQERNRLQKLEAEKRGKNFIYKKASPLELGGRTKGVERLFDIPNSWQWVSLGQVTWNLSDGPHFSPKYVEKGEGVAFISSRNVSYKKLDFEDAKYVSKEDHELFIQRGKPQIGDILLTKGGTTGIAHVINDSKEFSIWVHVALLKVVKKYVLPEYLRDVLTSQFGYIQSQSQTHGVGNQDLGLTRMVFIAVPLPPIDEQQEIVKRVEALFAKADAIEAQYLSLKEKIDKLPQALLAKAFKGELVPQDETDEPANVLLKRIQEDKQNFIKTKKETLMTELYR